MICHENGVTVKHLTNTVAKTYLTFVKVID